MAAIRGTTPQCLVQSINLPRPGCEAPFVSDMSGGLAIDSADNLFVGLQLAAFLRLLRAGCEPPLPPDQLELWLSSETLRLASQTSAPTDFNSDGKPDYLLYNASTHQTALWYLNNNVHIGGASGPTLPAGWQPVGVADFNLDGHPDYLLFNPKTRQTAIGILTITCASASGRADCLAGWNVAGVADFNLDGHPDYLLVNPVRGRRRYGILTTTCSSATRSGLRCGPAGV